MQFHIFGGGAYKQNFTFRRGVGINAISHFGGCAYKRNFTFGLEVRINAILHLAYIYTHGGGGGKCLKLNTYDSQI